MLTRSLLVGENRACPPSWMIPQMSMSSVSADANRLGISITNAPASVEVMHMLSSSEYRIVTNPSAYMVDILKVTYEL